MTRNAKPNYTLMRLMANAGLSISDLARLAGTSEPTVRAAAHRGHVPSNHIQRDIASVFELQATDIWPIPFQSRQLVAA